MLRLVHNHDFRITDVVGMDVFEANAGNLRVGFIREEMDIIPGLLDVVDDDDPLTVNDWVTTADGLKVGVGFKF